jgi:glycosyltransferase involved in cell wall biosynthesis
MGLESHVRFPGFVEDPELAALYQSCLGLIFPSLYEGFGLPVLEAMALGAPVLCSNIASLPQIAGDAAVYFDPRDPSEIAAAIERLATEGSLRARLIEQGSAHVARLGTSAQTAEDYLTLLREVAGVHAPEPLELAAGV